MTQFEAGGYWPRRASSEPCLERGSAAERVIPVLFSGAKEHLPRIRTNIFKYHVCSRELLVRWIGGIGRGSMASKKIAEAALKHAPKPDVERSLFLMDELYTSSMVSTEALSRR
jgi:hypothetical protein